MAAFLCRIDDEHGTDPDAGHEYEAYDAEVAAEKCASDYYDQEPCAADDFECVVVVTEIGSKKVKKFEVTARIDVDFTAWERDKDE